jgi:hypothetical protein
MKKIIVLAMLLLATHLCNAQEFMGIKVDGKINDVIEQFKSKGFIVTESKPTTYTLKGSLGNKEIEMYLHTTINQKLVWKLIIYLPKKDSWYSIKIEYEDFYDILTKKYGEPRSKYSFFQSPYAEGDGYEMTAIGVDKCFYSAFWENVSLQISKFKQIKISYENKINADIYEAEKNQNLKNSL